MNFERECVICGKSFRTNVTKKVICSFECSKESRRRYAREYAKAHRNPQMETKPCLRCGRIFTAGRGKLFCSDECKAACRGVRRKKPGKTLTLAQVARLANEAGMSYGEYVLSMEGKS